MKETTTAGGIVLNLMGQVLVVSQNGNSWSLPKGHVESDEELLEAAKREIYEESGINQLTFIKELGSYKRYRISDTGGDDITELKTIHMYLFTTHEEELKPIDLDNPEARWVEPENVADLLTHQKDKDYFLGCLELLRDFKNTPK